MLVGYTVFREDSFGSAQSFALVSSSTVKSLIMRVREEGGGGGGVCFSRYPVTFPFRAFQTVLCKKNGFEGVFCVAQVNCSGDFRATCGSELDRGCGGGGARRVGLLGV